MRYFLPFSFVISCILLCGGVSSLWPEKISETDRVHIRGIGSVLVGQTLFQAMASGQDDLVQELSGAEDYGCFYYHFKGGPQGLAFMVREKKIIRVDISNTRIKTISGIGVGSTRAEVLKTYGDRIAESAHQYIERGNYLTYMPKDAADKNFRLVFETDANGKVMNFRVGLFPHVMMVEGCL